MAFHYGEVGFLRADIGAGCVPFLLSRDVGLGQDNDAGRGQLARDDFQHARQLEALDPAVAVRGTAIYEDIAPHME